jgi:hypothetical protein
MIGYWNDVLTLRRGTHSDITEATLHVTTLRGRWAQQLGRSLAVFQIGESGDGSRLLAAAARQPEEFQSALRLFVEEEQEHARLLAVLLNALDQPLRQSHWTDTVFVNARRMMSLRTELLVLLAAEIIGDAYYRTVSGNVPDTAVADVLHRIADDEALHLAFHIDSLRRLCADWSRSTNLLVRCVWTLLLTCTSMVVALGHRRVLRLAGSTVTEFVGAVAMTGARTRASIWLNRSAYGENAELIDIRMEDQHRPVRLGERTREYLERHVQAHF